MEKKYKYDAFISYRHCDLDKFVAENLHRLLETYKMPKAVVEKFNIDDNNVRRVFRDQEELPLASNLEKPIIQALKESNFLIVICSPRLKESIWCRKEIENFIKFHGRSRILCVLIEKEPADSFPEELLYEEVETKVNGKIVKEKVSCEPLAMDVRGNNKKEVYSKMKSELIRLIAPMYNLDYDDIKRRHEERELKKKVRLFKIITLVSVLFAVYSFLLFFKIFTSNNQLKKDQAISLANQAEELLLNDNRNASLDYSYKSLTKYGKTSKGIYELTDSLGVYYTDNNVYPITQLDTKGLVESYKTDSDKKYLLSYDDSNELVLWDLKTKKRIKTITNLTSSFSKFKYSFIDNERFIYQNDKKELIITDINGKNTSKIKLDYTIQTVVVSNNGKYIVSSDLNKLEVYETKSLKLIGSYKVKEKYKIENRIYIDNKEENIVFGISKNTFELTHEIDMVTFNIKDNKEINTRTINSDYLVKPIFNGDDLILLSTKAVELDYTMTITSYNYKNNKLNFEKKYSGDWSIDIAKSNGDTDNLLVSAYSTAYILDYKTGKEKTMFAIGDRIVYTQTLRDTNYYLLFTRSGEVHVIDSIKYNDVVFLGMYNLNLSKYENVLPTSVGYAANTTRDNRIIIYGNLENKNIKEIKYKEKEFKKINYKEKNKIIDRYKFNKKSLISELSYSSDKKILFVSYTNNDLEVYNNDNKKLINTIKLRNNVDTYLGKTDNNEYIITGSSGGYILNKKFELIAYVPHLYDYNKGKLIIKNDNKFYQTKIFNYKELIKLAKDKLK